MALTFVYRVCLIGMTFLCTFVITIVYSRQTNFGRRILKSDYIEGPGAQGIFGFLGGLRNGRKNINIDTLSQAKFLYNALTKKFLRHDVSPEVPEADTKNDDPALIEHELEDSLAKKTSALQDKPYVQHKGENDFLVFKAGVKDPFVTVIPNDIYYNVEKRCVNWLDDCNERGLRARLLQQVMSPFK